MIVDLDSGWYLVDPSGKPAGPYTTDEIRARLRGRVIASSSPVSRAGGSEWRSVECWPEFARPAVQRATSSVAKQLLALLAILVVTVLAVSVAVLSSTRTQRAAPQKNSDTRPEDADLSGHLVIRKCTDDALTKVQKGDCKSTETERPDGFGHLELDFSGSVVDVESDYDLTVELTVRADALPRELAKVYLSKGGAKALKKGTRVRFRGALVQVRTVDSVAWHKIDYASLQDDKKSDTTASASATALAPQPSPEPPLVIDYESESGREASVREACRRSSAFCSTYDFEDILSHARSVAEKTKLEKIRRNINAKHSESMWKRLTMLKAVLRAGIDRQKQGEVVFRAPDCVKVMLETRKLKIEPLERELERICFDIPGAQYLATAAIYISDCWSCIDDMGTCKLAEERIQKAETAIAAEWPRH